MPKIIFQLLKTMTVSLVFSHSLTTFASGQKLGNSWFDFLGDSDDQYQGTLEADPIPNWFDETIKLIEQDPTGGLREISSFQNLNGYPDTTAFIVAVKIYAGLFLEDASLIQEQLKLIEPIGLRDRYRYYYEYGHSYLNWRDGNYDKAVEWSEKHVKTADRIDDLSLRVQSYSWKVLVFIFADQMYNAIQLGKEVQHLANLSNSIHVKLEAYSSLVQIHRNTYELGKAVEAYSKMIELGKQLNNSQRLGVMHYNLGEIQQRMELFDDAIQSHLTSIEYATKANDNYTTTYAYFSIATIKEKQGKYQESYKLLVTLVDRFKSEGDTTNEIYSRLDAASVATKMGDIESAKYWLNSISEKDHSKFMKRYQYDIKKTSIEAYLAEYSGDIAKALELNKDTQDKLKARMKLMIKDRLRQNKVQLERSTTQSELKRLKEQYMSLQSKYQQAQNQTRSNSNWFIVISILIITGFISSIYYLRTRLKLYQDLSGESGLANRPLFMRDLKRELSRHSRFNEPFGLALIKIQHPLNSQTEKSVFRALMTEQLENALRITDSIGYFDSVTFAVIFANTDRQTSEDLLIRIQKEIKEKLDTELAIGFTSLEGRSAPSTLSESILLQQAEIALLVSETKLRNTDEFSAEFRAA